MDETTSLEDILIAVAVHDDQEARIEVVDHDRIRVAAHVPARLRVSYRLADTSQRREAAFLKAIVEFDGEPLAEKEVTMRDRPMLDDEEHGDLTFETPPLRPGLHDVAYTVRLDVSDDTIEAQPKHTGAAKTVQGSFELEAVEE